MASISPHSPFVRGLLGVDETESVVCAVAFGAADPSAPVNALVSERAGVHAVVAPARVRPLDAGG